MRWATRASIHIDRASSAWLIRRFIDPEAVFEFAVDPGSVPPEAIVFDIRGVEFGHHGRGLHLRDPAAASRSRRPGAVADR